MVVAAPAPVTVAPAPMTAAVPAPMTMAPAAVMAVAPANFFRLEMIDFAFGGNGGMSFLAGRPSHVIFQRLRRQRRGLGTECCRARGNAQGKLQEIASFHDIVPLLNRE